MFLWSIRATSDRSKVLDCEEGTDSPRSDCWQVVRTGQVNKWAEKILMQKNAWDTKQRLLLGLAKIETNVIKGEFRRELIENERNRLPVCAFRKNLSPLSKKLSKTTRYGVECSD